jgi:Tfp pilus assembly protein PilF
MWEQYMEYMERKKLETKNQAYADAISKAKKEYDATVSTAWGIYSKIESTARDAYDAAIAAAWEAYGRKGD